MTLQEYLEEHSPSDLARKTGISRQAINNYRKGAHLPNLKTAVAIEEATNGEVTLYDWVVPARVSLI